MLFTPPNKMLLYHWIIDPTGTTSAFITVNELHVNLDLRVGRAQWLSTIHPDDIACCMQQFGTMLSERVETSNRFRQRTTCGQWLSFYSYGEPVYRGGSYVGCRGYCCSIGTSPLGGLLCGACGDCSQCSVDEVLTHELHSGWRPAKFV